MLTEYVLQMIFDGNPALDCDCVEEGYLVSDYQVKFQQAGIY